MVLQLTLSPDDEQKLRDLAQANATTVEGIVQDAIAKIRPLERPHASTLSPGERARLWREWAESHPRREGVHLDDSRESIYAGRGE